ncbi:MAG: flavodoxin family protein [Brevefilum sp.]
MSEKLVVYDSYFGNTEKIAEGIAEAIGGNARKINAVSEEDLEGLEVLFVGSPTRAFRPTPAILTFINSLDPARMRGVKAAAFDTRIPKDKTDSGFLRMMISLFGYADKKIEKRLANTGASVALESEGFGVTGTEGPLVEGELERAKEWAGQI